MKLRLGIVCILAALALGVVAIVSMHLALAAAMLGLGFALVGIGLLCEATDPRRKPKPRTSTEPFDGAVRVWDGDDWLWRRG